MSLTIVLKASPTLSRFQLSSVIVLSAVATETLRKTGNLTDIHANDVCSRFLHAIKGSPRGLNGRMFRHSPLHHQA